MLRPYCKTVSAPSVDTEIEAALRQAVRTATTPPYGPVAVEIASDLMGAYVSAACAPAPSSAARPSRELPLNVRGVPAPSPAQADVLAASEAATPLCAALCAAHGAGAPSANALELSDDEPLLLTCDPGACSALAAPLCSNRRAPVGGSRQWRVLWPDQEACVGFAVPAAIGAALAQSRAARASRPVTALADMQALLMTGPELTTAATERLPLVVVVPSFASASSESAPAPFLFGASIELPAFAKCLGFRYLKVDSTHGDCLTAAEATLRLAMAHATATDGGCVIVEWCVPAAAAALMPSRCLSTATITPEPDERSAGLAACFEAASVGLLVCSPSTPELLQLVMATGRAATFAAGAAHPPPLQVYLSTDDQSSGFVADGFARRSRAVAGTTTTTAASSSAVAPIAAVVVDATAPPGAFSGIGEACMDSTPLLLIVVQPQPPSRSSSTDASTDASARDAMQQLPAVMAVAGALCKASFDSAVEGSARHAIARAAAEARAGTPGPVAVYLRHPALASAHLALDEPSAAPSLPAATTPSAPLSDEALHAAAAAVATALSSAKQPRLHVGLGAIGCADECRQLAERLGCIVSSTFSGKGVFPEQHALWLWPGVGAALPPPLRAVDRACDAWLLVGARMGELASAHYRWPERRLTAFHVDIDPAVPASNVRGATPIVADAAAFMRALLRALETDPSTPPPAATPLPASHPACVRVREAHAAYREVVRAEEASINDTWVSPTALCRLLQARLPAATYVSDSGNGTTYCSESLRVSAPCRYMGPVNYSSMGFCVPAAIGATLALRSRSAAADEASEPVAVAMVGDGALRMTGFELASAVRAKLPLVVVVLSDGELGMMSGLQRAAGASPFCTVLNGFDACALAESVGAPARRVSSEGELVQAVEWAATHATRHGPVLLDVATCYAYPSFYARGIAGASAPPAHKLPKPPPKVRPSRPAGVARAVLAQSELARGHDADVWEVLRRAGRTEHPSRLAILNTDGSAGGSQYPSSLAYAGLLRRSAALAAALAARGVGCGCTVGLLTPNRAEAMEAHYAVGGSLRAIALNLNWRLSAAELAYILDDAECDLLIVDAAFAAPLLSAMAASSLEGGGRGGARARPIRCVVWLADGELPSTAAALGGAAEATEFVGYEALLAEGLETLPTESDYAPAWAQQQEQQQQQRGASHLPCEMYYTSGTTGRPKGVQLSHQIVVHHAVGCVVEHRLHSDDRWGHFSPMFHLVDAYSMYAITLAGGAHAFTRGEPSFSAALVLDAIEAHAVTVSNVASATVTMLLTEQQSQRTRDLSSLELLSCGGSPLSHELVHAALATFRCEFFLSYGMTECCGKISMSLLDQPTVRSLAPAQQLELLCTSGRPFGPLDVRLVGDDGLTPLDDREGVGEVQIRGPTVFSGYHNQPAATSDAFTSDGWFKTGDLARHEPYGYLTVCDRLKDMILTGGENVYSVEVRRASPHTASLSSRLLASLPFLASLPSLPSRSPLSSHPSLSPLSTALSPLWRRPPHTRRWSAS